MQVGAEQGEAQQMSVSMGFASFYPSYCFSQQAAGNYTQSKLRLLGFALLSTNLQSRIVTFFP